MAVSFVTPVKSYSSIAGIEDGQVKHINKALSVCLISVTLMTTCFSTPLKSFLFKKKKKSRERKLSLMSFASLETKTLHSVEIKDESAPQIFSFLPDLTRTH